MYVNEKLVNTLLIQNTLSEAVDPCCRRSEMEAMEKLGPISLNKSLAIPAILLFSLAIGSSS